MRKQDERGQEREALVKGLKEKLEWYTMCASDEEYDEKAVESILYLLDSLEPLDEAEEPEPEEAWGRFQALVREREERNFSGKAEVPGKLEMMGAVEALVKRKPAELAEIPNTSEALAMPELAEIPNTSEALAMSELAEIPNTSEALAMSELDKIPDTSGEVAMPELDKIPETSEEMVMSELDKIPDTSGEMVMSELDEISDTSGEMVMPELEELSKTTGKITGSGKVKSRKRIKVVGMSENGKETEVSEELGISARFVMGKLPVRTAVASTSRMLRGLANNQKGSVRYNKYIVAAVLVLLVVSVFGIIGNVQAGASPDNGFFHWLKRDNTGIQMITSPENLDSETDVKGVHTYFDREDVPEWAQEWLKIDDEFEMPANYEWDCYEVEEGRNVHRITSYYLDKDSKKEMLLGVIMYHGVISFNTEGLVDYNYVDSYDIEQKEINILCKTDNMGINYYLIYFFEGHCQYFMQGQDNLEQLKSLIEQYWLYVKNNLEENEIICNKLLSQAIYK